MERHEFVLGHINHPTISQSTTRSLVVWRSGNALLWINEVNLRRGRLVLWRVTVSGFNSRCGTFTLVCNQSPRSTQHGHPFVRGRNWVPATVTPCGWGVKACMVRVWVSDKTVWSPCYTRAISERFERQRVYIKRYINSSVYFTYLLFQFWRSAQMQPWWTEVRKL